MKPEEVGPEEIETSSPTEKPNVYIDIDGKWKLELGGAASGEETNVDEEKNEKNDEDAEVESEPEEVKWCQPVSVVSDDSSSSEEERVKLCYPIHAEGHKFSDGIVWETIEEEEEEEEVSSSESDNTEVTMNGGAESGNMKIDFNEGNIMQGGDTPAPSKKEVAQHQQQPQPQPQQSHKPFITELTRVNKPERGAVREMDTTREQQESAGYQSPVEDYEDAECQLKDDEKDCPVSKEELGNISVKNLARFWEEVSKKVKDEADKSEQVIPKKWYSMPNLKDKFEKRQLPVVPSGQLGPAPSKVVRSDEVIDDVDLCRSVSLRDRKQLFEMLSKQSKREKAKQWSSMPSLKEERKLPHLPSPTKTRVRWEDEGEEEEDDEEDDRAEKGFACESEMRGRSPVRELMKSFEQLPQHSAAYHRAPASPQVRRNEIFGLKDENYSSSDSISSSITCSSLSTVIQRSPRPASLYDDSAGEIYTEPENNATNPDPALYVVENGLEYSLASLHSRKSVFEHQRVDRIKQTVTTEREETRSLDSRREKLNHHPSSKANEMDRIKSTNVPYIEEEKDILKNINVVQSLKSKFLN